MDEAKIQNSYGVWLRHLTNDELESVARSPQVRIPALDKVFDEELKRRAMPVEPNRYVINKANCPCCGRPLEDWSNSQPAPYGGPPANLVEHNRRMSDALQELATRPRRQEAEDFLPDDTID